MDNAPYYDYTGLTSGHKRPEEVEQAHEAALDAWAIYNDACDRIEDGEDIPQETLMRLRQIAMRKDGEYSLEYDKWMQSY